MHFIAPDFHEIRADFVSGRAEEARHAKLNVPGRGRLKDERQTFVPGRVGDGHVCVSVIFRVMVPECELGEERGDEPVRAMIGTAVFRKQIARV